MSATHVGVGTPSGSAGDATPTKHANVVSGDLLLLLVESNSNQIPSSITGYTLVASSGSGGAGSTGLSVWERIADGTSADNPTIADVGNHLYAVIDAWRDHDGIDAVSTPNREENTDTSGESNGLTTTVNDAVVVDIVSTALDSATPAWSGWANSDLDFSGLGELFEGGTDAGSGGGIAIHAGVKATAGSVGTTTMTTPADHKAFVKLAIAPTAAGGTNHTRDVNDSVSIADSITPARGIKLTINDSAGLSDALGSEAEFFRSVNDPVSLADALSRVAEYFRTVADSVTVSDATTVGFFFARSVNDSVTIADAIARAMGLSRSVNDTVTVADVIARTLEMVRTINDSVTLADQATPELTPGGPNSWNVNINDSVTVLDSLLVSHFDAQIEAQMQRLWRVTRRRDARRSFG